MSHCAPLQFEQASLTAQLAPTVEAAVAVSTAKTVLCTSFASLRTEKVFRLVCKRKNYFFIHDELLLLRWLYNGLVLVRWHFTLILIIK